MCGWPETELAHTIGRARQDEKRVGPKGGVYLWVNPDSVIPLCPQRSDVDHDGKALALGCHAAYDGHELDLLGFLTLKEELNAVRAAGSIAAALRRITGSRD